MMLAELHTRFPFGVFLLSDDQSSDEIPEWANSQQQVTASRTALVGRIRHEQDGPATIRIWTEPPPSAGGDVGAAVLEANSGLLRLSDAIGNRVLRVPVQSSSVYVRVLASEPSNAREIDLVIAPASRILASAEKPVARLQL